MSKSNQWEKMDKFTNKNLKKISLKLFECIVIKLFLNV